MTKSVARGKALVAKLRADPKTRDAEALAAWIGRFKRLRKMGVKPSRAMQLAGEEGGISRATRNGKRKTSGGSLAERVRTSTAPKKKERESVIARPKRADDSDPFAEDFGDNEPKSKEDKQRERHEAQLAARMEKEERSRLHSIFSEAGGLKTREDLKEEYRAVPNNLKRKDGMPGDEMADYLATYYPEFGIESENDLLDYFAA